MTDIRELLHSATPVVDDDFDVELVRRGAQQRRTRRIAMILTATIAVVGIGTTVALTRREHRSHRHVIVSRPSTNATTTPTTVFDTASTGVERLPMPALSPRDGAAMVWTGTGLVEWGGNLDAPNSGLPGPYQSFNDGAAYSPVTHAWTALAASPLPANAQRSVGVRTDNGIVFARGRETALWTPATNSWRKLGDAPATVSDMTFTGSEVVSYTANATLDVRSGAWRSLPAIPVRLDRATLAWTGHELVVIGGPNTAFTSAVAIALDPSRREWRRIADPPTEVHAEALAASWDGHRVIVVNYDLRAIAYDPARNAWSTLPNVPARFSEWSPAAASAGGYTVVFMAQSVAVLRPDGTWVPLPYGDIPFGNIAGPDPAFDPQPADGLLFISGIDNRTRILAAVDLQRVVATASRLQVGGGSILPPAGYRLRASRYDGPKNDFTSGTVTVDLAGPNGATCSAKSRYTGIIAPTFGELRLVSLETDGSSKAWYRNVRGTEWQTASSSSDSFAIECSSPAAARELAVSASFK